MKRSLGIMRFGDLAPDQPDFGGQQAIEARNCIPRANGYRPLPEVEPFSAAAPDRPVGAISVADFDGTAYTYAGTLTDLIELQASNWVSRGSGLNAATRWEFSMWGREVFATSFTNELQKLTVGGAAFGRVYAPETLRAETMCVVKNQILLGNVEDVDGHTANRVRWCAVNDPDDWAPDSVTLAGATQLESQNGGAVVRLIGGEFALAFLERSIFRGTFTGSPAGAYQWDEVDPQIVTLSPDGVVRLGTRVFFLSDDGFRATVGGRSEQIGEERIDATVLSELDETHIVRVRSVAYPDDQIVVWAYPGPGNVGGTPNKLAIYNAAVNKWSLGEEAVEVLYRARSSFVSPDDAAWPWPIIDQMPGSLDDSQYTGGTLEVGVIDSQYRVGFFVGPPRDALFETAETQHFPGRRAFVGEVRPIVSGGGATVSVGCRNRQQDGVTYKPATSTNITGFAPVRCNSRYTRYRVNVSGQWEYAVGVEPFGAQAGGR